MRRGVALALPVLKAWDKVMDRLRQFLVTVRTSGAVQGRLRGLLHILIGRRISLPDGTVVSAGMTWREVAAALKKHRWEPDDVRELGLDPSTLPPRDRQKYWYTAISRAGVASAEAVKAADELVPLLAELGYNIGSAPGGSSSSEPGA